MTETIDTQHDGMKDALIQICLTCPLPRCVAKNCRRYASEARRLRGQKTIPDESICTKNGRFATYEYNGKAMNLAQWAMELGINESTLRARIYRGENFTEAISRPKKVSPLMLVEYKGEKMPLHSLCQMHGIDVRTYKQRINYGWSVERALETPKRKKESRSRTHDA